MHHFEALKGERRLRGIREEPDGERVLGTNEMDSMGCQHVDGTNRRIQSALFLNRKCIFKTLSTWLMDVNNLDFTPFTTEKSKIHWICCRCFVGWYELQHYRSSAVQLGAFLWACPFKIMLQ